MDTIGQRISDKRKIFGYSQHELAEKCGFSDQTVSAYETGVHIPNANSLVILSKALHVSIDWLVTGREFVRRETDGIADLSEKLGVPVCRCRILPSVLIINTAHKEAAYLECPVCHGMIYGTAKPYSLVTRPVAGSKHEA